MDVLVVGQYRFILGALAAGLLIASAVAIWLARRAAPEEPAAPEPPDDAAQRQVLPHVMLLLVALAAGAGVLLLLPAAMILRYIPGRPVVVLLVCSVCVLAAPLLYAWRARPFQT